MSSAAVLSAGQLLPGPQPGQWPNLPPGVCGPAPTWTHAPLAPGVHPGVPQAQERKWCQLTSMPSQGERWETLVLRLALTPVLGRHLPS